MNCVFAAGANRDYMEAIEFTGLSLDNLIDVALEEMCAIADETGTLKRDALQ